MDRKKYLVLAFIIFAWSSYYLVSERLLAADAISPIKVNFLVLLIAFFCLVIFMAKDGKAREARLSSIRGAGPKKLIFTSLLGLVGIFLYYVLILTALSWTSATNAIALNYTYPIFMLILGHLFLKEKMSSRVYAAAVLSFIAVLLVFGQGGLAFDRGWLSLMGDLFALGAGFSWAAFSVAGKKFSWEDKVSETFVYFSSGLVASFLLAAGTGNLDLNISRSAFAGILYIAIIPTATAYLLWFKLLKQVDISKIAPYMFLIAPISVLLSVALVGDRPSVYSLAGFVLILLSIAIAGWKSGKVKAV